MSNNIIVLSSDDEGSDEGDNTIDPWVLYSSKTNTHSDKKIVYNQMDYWQTIHFRLECGIQLHWL